MLKATNMNLEDAANLLIQWMRNPYPGARSSYGYDVYLPSMILSHLQTQGVPQREQEQLLPGLIPHFYAAAWELCRRGILRPGVHSYLAQSTEDGNAGNGYSITPFGKKWLSESDLDDYVPTEPGRFASMLEEYRDRFGQGFHERAQKLYVAMMPMDTGRSSYLSIASLLRTIAGK
ncbi:MAG: hypothetical protein GY797_04230 [Deltaproteobacteria bacterium]|nr:hypothetical protein [Deltaproteobacteria bacterium]